MVHGASLLSPDALPSKLLNFVVQVFITPSLEMGGGTESSHPLFTYLVFLVTTPCHNAI